MDFYWLRDFVGPLIESIDKPGSGGIIFSLVFGTAALTYLLSTRWILRGSDDGAEDY